VPAACEKAARFKDDDLGQVESGKKYWSDATKVPGSQFEYTFDHIGNRRSAKTGGDSAGNNLRTQVFEVDDRNTYSTRTFQRYVGVSGSANANALVSLWSEGGIYSATSRRGDFF